MSNSQSRRRVFGVVAGILLISIGTFFTLHRNSVPFVVPPLEDEPEVAVAKREPLSQILPAYGIIMGSSPELQAKVAVETDDAPLIRVGERVWVRSSRFASERGKVVRFLGGAIPETGQGIAWISVPNPDGRDHSGEFVWVRIEAQAGKATLVVPASAIVTKEHKTWVVSPKKDEKGKQTFEPTEVEIGRANGEKTEILKGIEEGTEVLVSGAVGYLYPNFKSGAGD